MEPQRTSTEGQVMGIIGIVLGVISLIVAFIPCVGVVAFFPGGLAIIFSIVSIVQASKGNGAKNLGIASFVISCLAIIIAAAWLIIFSGVSVLTNKAMKDPDLFEQIGKDIKHAFDEVDDERSSVKIDTLENVLRELENPEDDEDNPVEDEPEE
ncbi:MAG: DUF308 domain-containing protein [Bacteroidales bacterium]